MINSDNNINGTKSKYLTLRRPASASFEERKSLFIGHAAPVKTEEGAAEFIRGIKTKYADATHNVYAYIVRGGAAARYSDDGEPQGTAGIPVLDVMKKSGVEDSCVVVTRYFGGTMLGAGGLVRAYTEAAKIALEAAEIAEFEPYTVLQLSCSYSDYQRILPIVTRADAIVDSTDFLADVRLTAAVKSNFVDSFLEQIAEQSAGRINAVKISERFDCK